MLLLMLILLSLGRRATSVCYFPVEYQGIFVTQSTLAGGPSHTYSEIIILPDGIPVWGVCHKKSGNSLILYDNTGGQECYRCFHLTLHSPNVIQVFTEGLDKCYTHEEAAGRTCPTLLDIKTRKAREIMLYKSKSFEPDELIERVFCPISGKYHFSYDVDDGTEEDVECADSSSTISNCPQGSEFYIRFSRCKFGESRMSLRCLGNWLGMDGHHYLALWASQGLSSGQPRYRCAMYHIEKDTRRVFLSFSIDATCTNQLESPWEGYETMILTPTKPSLPPSPTATNFCTFPAWAQGEWQDLQIQGRELWIKDSRRDKLFETVCLSQEKPFGERFALYSRNQCGDEEFTCIHLKSRDVNVLEFQIAVASKEYTGGQLCSDDAFVSPSDWITQGRLSHAEMSRCPVLGEYEGVIPDDNDLCAKLASDCLYPQMMHYTVSSCRNRSEVFEERDYQCLGQWTEAGVRYTFTYRRDVGTYECFAGVVVNSHEVFIIEAGVNCQRGLQPLSKGMKLIRQATCDQMQVTPPTSVPVTHPTLPPHSTTPHTLLPPWWLPTTKIPWFKKTTSVTPKPRWKNQKPWGAENSASCKRLYEALGAKLLTFITIFSVR